MQRTGALITCLALSAVASVTAVSSDRSPVVAAPLDVLTMVNDVRAAAGLAPVGLDDAASEHARLHACWMVANDRLAHTEEAGTPAYSDAGRLAAGRSNVGTSSSRTSTDASFVDIWLSGPYHAIGMLRPGLRTIGYGRCEDDSGRVRSAASLDVLGGLVQRPITAPILFPADGATTTLRRFVTETPDPTINCPASPAGYGLPLLAMLPESPRQAAATLTGPDGPVAVCLVTGDDDRNADGRSLLAGDRAVSIIPMAPLTPGTWQVRLDTASRSVRWSFDVAGGSAPYVAPRTSVLGQPSRFVPDGPRRVLDTRRPESAVARLSSGIERAVPIAGVPAGAQAVAVTVTATEAAAEGWVSLHPCSTGSGGTSTVNVRAGATVANAVVVPLGGGDVCLLASTPVDVIVDVSGWFVTGGAGWTLQPSAQRVLDTRGGARLTPGRANEVSVAPPGTGAVSLGLVTTDVLADGHVTVWGGPCDAPPATSAAHARVGATTATPLITAVSPRGTVCIATNATTHLVVDRQAVLSGTSGLSFVPLAPTRVLDSRSTPSALTAAGLRGRLPSGTDVALPLAVPGTPAGMAGAFVVVTATDTTSAGWVTLVACAAGTVSNVNTAPGSTTAAGASTGTDRGLACLRTSGTTHVVVDLTGAFVP